MKITSLYSAKAKVVIATIIVAWCWLYIEASKFDVVMQCVSDPKCDHPKSVITLPLVVDSQDYVEPTITEYVPPSFDDYDFGVPPPPPVVKKVKPKPSYVLEEGDDEQVNIVAKKVKLKVTYLLATNKEHIYEFNEGDQNLYNHLVTVYNVNLDHAYWWTLELQSYAHKTGIPLPMIITILNNFSTGFYIDVEAEKKKINK